MLIEDYDLTVFTPPCSPGDERFSAIATLQTDIREALPYLNATLKNAAYSAAAQALSWRKGSHYVVFHPDRIAVSNVEDRFQAVTEMEALVALVNQTWGQRSEIEPSYEAQPRPTAMALFKLLPGTNCRECGEPTCWNFSLKLASAQAIPADCAPLRDAAYADRLAQLQALVPDPSTD